MIELDPLLPVLVLRLVVDPFQHGGLGIARSLGRLGVDVYAVQTGGPAPASRSRYIRENVPLDPEASAERIVATLLEAAARAGGRAILIPIDDPSAVFAHEHEEALRQAFVFPDQPAGLPARLASKRQMHELTSRLGIPNPATSYPQSRADVERFLETATFPVVLKAIDGERLLARAGARMLIVESAGDLLAAYDRLEEPADPNLMLQEYIPGGPESVWMFNGYFDHDSNALVGFTGRKLRQHPPYTGASSLAVCLPNATVDEQTRRLMREIGYRGILDIDYHYDARDGAYKVLDINPRIGATFRLFVAENGIDVARALYLDLTGQPVPASAVRPGRKWLVESHDPVSSLRYWRDGRLTAAQWLSSFRGLEETAWFARDDLRPTAALSAELVRRAVRRLRRSRNGPA